jgi:hypothetical protein
LGDKDAEERKPSTTDPVQHMGSSRMILQPPSAGQSASGAMPGSEFADSPMGDPGGSDPDASFAGPVASATIAPPPTQFMPASMTPSSAQPLNSAVLEVPPAPPPTPSPATPPAPPLPPPANPAPMPPPPAPFAPSIPSAPVPPQPGGDVTQARDALAQAFSAQQPTRPEPIQALNAQPLGDPLHMPPPPAPGGSIPPDLNVPIPVGAPAPPQDLNIPVPVGAPPPVPPPMMPPSPQ